MFEYFNRTQEIRFTVKIPAGVKVDLDDEFFGMMQVLVDSEEGVTFKQEERVEGETRWRVIETEQSFPINSSDKAFAHFKGRKMVVTPHSN